VRRTATSVKAGGCSHYPTHVSQWKVKGVVPHIKITSYSVTIFTKLPQK